MAETRTTLEGAAVRLARSINTRKGSGYAIPAPLRADLLEKLNALLASVSASGGAASGGSANNG